MVQTVTSEFLNNVLDGFAKNLNIKNYDVHINPGNKKGDGYLGEIIFLDLTDKDTGTTHNILVKRAFTKESIRTTAPIRTTFLNEINFYSNVLPTLQSFAKKIGITVFNNIPKCYFTSKEEGNEYLIIENLKSAGYEVFDKKKIVPYDHIELIYRTYAKLHATSILHRIYEPEEHNQLLSGLVEVMDNFFENEQFQKVSQDMCRTAGEKLIPGKDDGAIEVFKPYANNGMSLFRNSIYYKGHNPVICHGDCWSNNMLFKYNDTHEIEDMKLIDWQIVKKGSPVHDLSYSLYSGASKDTFDRLDDLLNAYYETFSSIFKEVGEDADKIYPLSTIKDEWKEYSTYGMIMAIMILKGKTTDDDDLIDLTDITDGGFDEETMNKFIEGTKSNEYDNRIRSLITHLYEINAL